jgi:hypothetical protein
MNRLVDNQIEIFDEYISFARNQEDTLKVQVSETDFLCQLGSIGIMQNEAEVLCGYLEDDEFSQCNFTFSKKDNLWQQMVTPGDKTTNHRAVQQLLKDLMLREIHTQDLRYQPSKGIWNNGVNPLVDNLSHKDSVVGSRAGLSHESSNLREASEVTPKRKKKEDKAPLLGVPRTSEQESQSKKNRLQHGFQGSIKSDVNFDGSEGKAVSERQEMQDSFIEMPELANPNEKLRLPNSFYHNFQIEFNTDLNESVVKTFIERIFNESKRRGQVFDFKNCSSEELKLIRENLHSLQLIMNKKEKAEQKNDRIDKIISLILDKNQEGTGRSNNSGKDTSLDPRMDFAEGPNYNMRAYLKEQSDPRNRKGAQKTNSRENSFESQNPLQGDDSRHQHQSHSRTRSITGSVAKSNNNDSKRSLMGSVNNDESRVSKKVEEIEKVFKRLLKEEVVNKQILQAEMDEGSMDQLRVDLKMLKGLDLIQHEVREGKKREANLPRKKSANRPKPSIKVQFEEDEEEKERVIQERLDKLVIEFPLNSNPAKPVNMMDELNVYKYARKLKEKGDTVLIREFLKSLDGKFKMQGAQLPFIDMDLKEDTKLRALLHDDDLKSYLKEMSVTELFSSPDGTEQPELSERIKTIEDLPMEKDTPKSFVLDDLKFLRKTLPDIEIEDKDHDDNFESIEREDCKGSNMARVKNQKTSEQQNEEQLEMPPHTSDEYFNSVVDLCSQSISEANKKYLKVVLTELMTNSSLSDKTVLKALVEIIEKSPLNSFLIKGLLSTLKPDDLVLFLKAVKKSQILAIVEKEILLRPKPNLQDLKRIISKALDKTSFAATSQDLQGIFSTLQSRILTNSQMKELFKRPLNQADFEEILQMTDGSIALEGAKKRKEGRAEEEESKTKTGKGRKSSIKIKDRNVRKEREDENWAKNEYGSRERIPSKGESEKESKGHSELTETNRLIEESEKLNEMIESQDYKKDLPGLPKSISTNSIKIFTRDRSKGGLKANGLTRNRSSSKDASRTNNSIKAGNSSFGVQKKPDEYLSSKKVQLGIANTSASSSKKQVKSGTKSSAVIGAGKIDEKASKQRVDLDGKKIFKTEDSSQKTDKTDKKDKPNSEYKPFHEKSVSSIPKIKIKDITTTAQGKNSDRITNQKNARETEEIWKQKPNEPKEKGANPEQSELQLSANSKGQTKNSGRIVLNRTELEMEDQVVIKTENLMKNIEDNKELVDSIENKLKDLLSSTLAQSYSDLPKSKDENYNSKPGAGNKLKEGGSNTKTNQLETLSVQKETQSTNSLIPKESVSSKLQGSKSSSNLYGSSSYGKGKSDSKQGKLRTDVLADKKSVYGRSGAKEGFRGVDAISEKNSDGEEIGDPSRLLKNTAESKSTVSVNKSSANGGKPNDEPVRVDTPTFTFKVAGEPVDLPQVQCLKPPSLCSSQNFEKVDNLASSFEQPIGRWPKRTTTTASDSKKRTRLGASGTNKWNVSKDSEKGKSNHVKNTKNGRPEEEISGKSSNKDEMEFVSRKEDSSANSQILSRTSVPLPSIAGPGRIPEDISGVSYDPASKNAVEDSKGVSDLQGRDQPNGNQTLARSNNLLVPNLSEMSAQRSSKSQSKSASKKFNNYSLNNSKSALLNNVLMNTQSSYDLGSTSQKKNKSIRGNQSSEKSKAPNFQARRSPQVQPLHGVASTDHSTKLVADHHAELIDSIGSAKDSVENRYETRLSEKTPSQLSDTSARGLLKEMTAKQGQVSPKGKPTESVERKKKKVSKPAKTKKAKVDQSSTPSKLVPVNKKDARDSDSESIYEEPEQLRVITEAEEELYPPTHRMSFRESEKPEQSNLDDEQNEPNFVEKYTDHVDREESSDEDSKDSDRGVAIGKPGGNGNNLGLKISGKGGNRGKESLQTVEQQKTSGNSDSISKEKYSEQMDHKLAVTGKQMDPLTSKQDNTLKSSGKILSNEGQETREVQSNLSSNQNGLRKNVVQADQQSLQLDISSQSVGKKKSKKKSKTIEKAKATAKEDGLEGIWEKDQKAVGCLGKREEVKEEKKMETKGQLIGEGTMETQIGTEGISKSKPQKPKDEKPIVTENEVLGVGTGKLAIERKEHVEKTQTGSVQAGTRIGQDGDKSKALNGRQNDWQVEESRQKEGIANNRVSLSAQILNETLSKDTNAREDESKMSNAGNTRSQGKMSIAHQVLSNRILRQKEENCEEASEDDASDQSKEMNAKSNEKIGTGSSNQGLGKNTRVANQILNEGQNNLQTQTNQKRNEEHIGRSLEAEVNGNGLGKGPGMDGIQVKVAVGQGTENGKLIDSKLAGNLQKNIQTSIQQLGLSRLSADTRLKEIKSGLRSISSDSKTSMSHGKLNTASMIAEDRSRQTAESDVYIREISGDSRSGLLSVDLSKLRGQGTVSGAGSEQPEVPSESFRKYMSSMEEATNKPFDFTGEYSEASGIFNEPRSVSTVGLLKGGEVGSTGTLEKRGQQDTTAHQGLAMPISSIPSSTKSDRNIGFPNLDEDFELRELLARKTKLESEHQKGDSGASEKLEAAQFDQHNEIGLTKREFLIIQQLKNMLKTGKTLDRYLEAAPESRVSQPPKTQSQPLSISTANYNVEWNNQIISPETQKAIAGKRVMKVKQIGKEEKPKKPVLVQPSVLIGKELEKIEEEEDEVEEQAELLDIFTSPKTMSSPQQEQSIETHEYQKLCLHDIIVYNDSLLSQNRQSSESRPEVVSSAEKLQRESAEGRGPQIEERTQTENKFMFQDDKLIFRTLADEKWNSIHDRHFQWLLKYFSQNSRKLKRKSWFIQI